MVRAGVYKYSSCSRHFSRGIKLEGCLCCRQGDDSARGQRPRCLVPESDGTEIRRPFREALWAKFYTGAPARQRRSVEQYSGVKRVNGRWPYATGSVRQPSRSGASAPPSRIFRWDRGWRKQSSTMRILSSTEKCRRVARLMFFITCSSGFLALEYLGLVLVPSS